MPDAARFYRPDDLRRNPERYGYCPRCRCNRSGYVDEVNGRTEACDDYRCLCHDEEWVQEDVVA